MPGRAHAPRNLRRARVRRELPGADARRTTHQGAGARRRRFPRNGRERREGRDDPVATSLVQGPTLGDRLLRSGQRCDRGTLEGDEDPGAHVLLQPRHPRHELLVSEHEAEPPARHAVALREREELDPDLARARLGKKASRRAPVEDEIAVGEVVQDGPSVQSASATASPKTPSRRCRCRSDSTGS